jgi:hypothetical protein
MTTTLTNNAEIELFRYYCETKQEWVFFIKVCDLRKNDNCVVCCILRSLNKSIKIKKIKKTILESSEVVMTINSESIHLVELIKSVTKDHNVLNVLNSLNNNDQKTISTYP